MFSETEIAILLQKNDIAVFEYLYDHYASALYGFILLYKKNADEASRILRDSFLAIHKKRRSFNPDKSRLFIWMLRITLHHPNLVKHITPKLLMLSTADDTIANK